MPIMLLRDTTYRRSSKHPCERHRVLRIRNALAHSEKKERPISRRSSTQYSQNGYFGVSSHSHSSPDLRSWTPPGFSSHLQDGLSQTGSHSPPFRNFLFQSQRYPPKRPSTVPRREIQFWDSQPSSRRGDTCFQFRNRHRRGVGQTRRLEVEQVQVPIHQRLGRNFTNCNLVILDCRNAVPNKELLADVASFPLLAL